MEIKLTKEQYSNLLKLVYLGNWMVNAIRTGTPGDEHIEAFDELESYMFSFAKAFGFEEYADHDEKNGKVYPTREFEDNPELRDFVDKYDDYTFWMELIGRLALRDLYGKYGDEVSRMDWRERIELLSPIEKVYSEEFEQNGIDNIYIISTALI